MLSGTSKSVGLSRLLRTWRPPSFHGWVASDSIKMYSTSVMAMECELGYLDLYITAACCFRKIDFKNSNIQITYTLSRNDSSIEKLSWGGREAHIVRDHSFYEAMIRKSYGLSETVRVEIPDAHSGHIGLRSITFIGNKGIEDLRFRCNAEHYIFRGMNHINRLGFNEFDSDSQNLNTNIYLGPREKIDPNFHHTLQHRNLFISIKEHASKKQDSWMVNVLDKQLDRIEYFLTKEQEVSIRNLMGNNGSNTGRIEFFMSGEGCLPIFTDRGFDL